MSQLELYGWVGGILFAVCGIPQVIQCYKQGHSDGLSWAFLLCWLFGEILTIMYVWPKKDWPLLFNYTINVLCLVVIVSYKIWPQERAIK